MGELSSIVLAEAAHTITHMHAHTHTHTYHQDRMLACLLSCDVSHTQIHSQTQTNCSDDVRDGQKYLQWKSRLWSQITFCFLSVIFNILVIYATHPYAAVLHQTWVKTHSFPRRNNGGDNLCLVPDDENEPWSHPLETPFMWFVMTSWWRLESSNQPIDQ